MKTKHIETTIAAPKRRTFGDVMRESVATENAELAGRIADRCRFQLGWNYDTLISNWCKAANTTPAIIESLLYAADTMEH